MRFSITYTHPDKPSGKLPEATNNTCTFYTEDKDAVRRLVQSGLNKGYTVTTRIVTDAP